MSDTKIFDSETALPDERLGEREKSLLGFQNRYERVRDQLRLLLNQSDLAEWNSKHHGGKLALCSLVAEQYPLVIFHGDVGTGKTATAECIANRLVADAKTDDSTLFKLSNRVRGSGKVGEMGTLLADAFQKISQAAGKGRRSVLLIDEGDSLAAARAQDHSHHEDKVAVNTLIQGIDDLRRFKGRVVVFLCTNRVSVVDAALVRRAAIIEEFLRPSAKELQDLFAMDLAALKPDAGDIRSLVALTQGKGEQIGWTYSDIRTRLYPAALARAFPRGPLKLEHLVECASEMKPSPAVRDQ